MRLRSVGYLAGSLMLAGMLSTGCAKMSEGKDDAAVARAEDAARRAETAGSRAEAASGKTERSFKRKMKK